MTDLNKNVKATELESKTEIGQAEIQERVIKVMINQVDDHTKPVKLESALGEDLGFDSLDSVEAIMALEDAFDGLEIPDEDAEKMKTVSDIVQYITARLSKK